MKIFVLGLPHTQSNLKFTTCAYTMKVINLCKMLYRRGHEVYHFGTEGSDVECTEHIDVTSEKLWSELYGHPGKNFYHFEMDGKYKPYSDSYVLNTRKAMLKRINSDYEVIICIPWGGLQMQACKGFRQFIIESGIGYPELHGAPYKIFESYAWWNFHNGKRNKPEGGCWYETVIPNAFDPDMFEYEKNKSDYFLYLGRITPEKGVDVAVRCAEKLKHKLIICGQGNPSQYLKSNFVKYVPPVGVEERKKILSCAKALFVPTVYIEPFGGVAVEGMMSGTPVITSDFGVFSETVLHGHTGYRCRTMDEFFWAAKNIDNINPLDCRNWAFKNYSLSKIVMMYEEYFQSILNLQDRGFVQEFDERKSLNSFRKVYPSSFSYQSDVISELPKHESPKLISRWTKASMFENMWWTSKENEKWDKEKEKQKFYARYMDIHGQDFSNKTILDIGGGPISMLFDYSFKEATVIDPLIISEKIKNKYKNSRIEFLNFKAENMDLDKKYDECWIYNCLSHVESPGKILNNVMSCCDVIRLFEWIKTGGDIGHPHVLTEEWFENFIDSNRWKHILWNSGTHRYQDDSKCEYITFVIKNAVTNIAGAC